MPAARKRFFVSYSHADRALVERLVEYLRITEANVFFDLDTIKPGDDWADRIQQAIRGASKFVVFWCDHSANSDYVQKEWTLALDNNKKIIPVLLDSTQLPPKLKRFQWLDFRDFGQALHRPLKGAAGAQAYGASGKRIIAPFVILAILAATIWFLPRYASGESLRGIAPVGLIVLVCVAVVVFLLRMVRGKGPIPASETPTRIEGFAFNVMAERLKERLQAEALNDAQS